MRHVAKTFLCSCECPPNFTEYNPNNNIHPCKFKSTPPVLPASNSSERISSAAAISKTNKKTAATAIGICGKCMDEEVK